MYIKKEFILIIIFGIIAIFSLFINKKNTNLQFRKLGLYGHKTLCKHKLLNHQHLIIPNLWLGDYESSQNIKFLKDNNIKLIINLSKNLNFVTEKNIEKYRIPIHDNLSKESNLGLIKHFDEAYLKIEKTLKNNDGVLIHCRAGVQRSAALTALYLMKKNKITSDDAKKFIKGKRCIVFFNKANFEPVLKYYDYI